jgi:StAR-related lipid transfer protein 10
VRRCVSPAFCSRGSCEVAQRWWVAPALSFSLVSKPTAADRFPRPSSFDPSKYAVVLFLVPGAAQSFDKTKLEGGDGEYATPSDKDFDEFVAACDEDDGWSVVYEDKKSGTKVWDKSSKDSPINLVKLYGKFPDIDALVMYDVLHDPDYRKSWDDNMIEGTELKVLDPLSCSVGYYSAKAPMGVTNRDFVTKRFWRANKADGEYIIMNHSVQHEDRPDPMKGFIRAISIRTGYLVRSDGKGSCEMLYVTQADMMGWVPAWLMNKVTKKFAPSIVQRLNKVALAYPEWKADHSKGEHPWRPADDEGDDNGAGKDESSSSSD